MKRSHPPRAPRQWARAVAAAVLTLAAAMPVWAYLHTEPSQTARWAVAAMATFGALFPAPALLVCAAFVPLCGPLSALLGASGAASLAEPFVLAFLAGWGLWLLATGLGPASWRDPDGRARFAVRAAIMPAAALAVVVAASAAVELFAIQPAVDDPMPFVAAAARYLYTGFFDDRGRFDAIVSAAFVLEGIGLYAAAVILIGRDRRLAGQLFAMAAAGAAGVAALNVTRLVVVWQRSGGSLETLTGLWGSMRVSAVFGDPNAAGSYLGLALLLVAGLALGGRLWLPVLPIVAAALWLTGSRAALVSTVLGAVVLLPTAMRASRRLACGDGGRRRARAGGVAAVRGGAIDSRQRLRAGGEPVVQLPRGNDACGRQDDRRAPGVRRRRRHVPPAVERLHWRRPAGDGAARERAQQLPPGARRARRRRVCPVPRGPGPAGVAGGTRGSRREPCRRPGPARRPDSWRSSSPGCRATRCSSSRCRRRSGCCSAR